jgi:hypothetical protein
MVAIVLATLALLIAAGVLLSLVPAAPWLTVAVLFVALAVVLGAAPIAWRR